MVDDRDLTGPQALDEQLRLRPEARGPGDARRVRVAGACAAARWARAAMRRADARRGYAALSSSLAWRRRRDVVGVRAEHPHELADDLARSRAA